MPRLSLNIKEIGLLKLASWNVNSIKIRLEQVLAWIEQTQTDILALQETKIIDEQFPSEVFTTAGYHVAYAGQKSYNGVAIISKYPLSDVLVDVPDYTDPQRRVLAATVEGIRVINLYVPNGSSPESEKYLYKLNWLREVTRFIEAQMNLYPHMAIVGDFNIAPEDRDVHDPLAWIGQVLVSEPEREAFATLLKLGFQDSFRQFHQDGQHFSWWDYRAAGFRRNRGVRIDHILLSEALSPFCTHAHIDIEPRKSERPSDHAPIWVELKNHNLTAQDKNIMV